MKVKPLVDRAHLGVTDHLYPGSEITAEEAAFGAALECYKRRSGRPFPTCSEVLAVLKSLRYALPDNRGAGGNGRPKIARRCKLMSHKGRGKRKSKWERSV
jgi:hypothetical protein